MSPRRPGTPEMGAREYRLWTEAVDAVDSGIDQLRDAIASALPDDQSAPLFAQLEVIEGLRAAEADHAEAAFKALAAALLPRKAAR